MFRKNEGYKQQNLFGVSQSLTKKQRAMWNKSREHNFFESIFCKIDEESFRVLYSNKKSRPNVAVNQLVGALILKHLYDWTYEELFTHLSFNMLTRHALGINDWTENVFSEASLFNFQNRVSAHYVETGQDLFTQVFDKLTVGQLSDLNISTKIQRGDSFLMGSNIFDYSRVHLLLEIIHRLYRILDEEDKIKVKSEIEPYLKTTAGQYIFRLEKGVLPKEIEKLGFIYHTLYERLKEKYRDDEVFKIFERAYIEHFEIVAQKVKVIDGKELTSGNLMSPDDGQATFRKKGKERSKGYTGHISETADPDNQINLITDIDVQPNNVDDAKILENRLGEMLKKTPGLAEYHGDGLYGSPSLDILMEKEKIKQIQTSMRGRRSNGGMEMWRQENGQVIVKCGGGQSVQAIRKSKTWRAEFDYVKCEKCPLKDKCTARITGTKRNNPKRYLTFYDKVILCHARARNINSIPEERRTIRANVEATVKEAKRGIKNGKLRVRGLLKAKFYLVWTALAINLTRIHRFSFSKTPFLSNFMASYFLKQGMRQSADEPKQRRSKFYASNFLLSV